MILVMCDWIEDAEKGWFDGAGGFNEHQMCLFVCVCVFVCVCCFSFRFTFFFFLFNLIINRIVFHFLFFI